MRFLWGIGSFPLIALTMLGDVYRRLRTETSPFLVASVHGIFIVNFVVWLILAPQFRFILPVYIFYGLWAVWRWVNPLIGITGVRMQALPYISIGLLFLMSVYPLDLEVQSTSTHIGKIDSFSFKTAVKPHVSYHFPEVDTLVIRGAEYYHVTDNRYCWDSPLPCMSVYYKAFLDDVGYTLESKGKVEFGLVQSAPIRIKSFSK